MSAVEEVVQVLEFGASKYEPFNWQKGIHYSRIYDATMRHLNDWYHKKEQNANDSNLHHLAHACCNLLFLLWYERNLNRKWDDRR